MSGRGNAVCVTALPCPGLWWNGLGAHQSPPLHGPPLCPHQQRPKPRIHNIIAEGGHCWPRVHVSFKLCCKRGPKHRGSQGRAACLLASLPSQPPSALHSCLPELPHQTSQALNLPVNNPYPPLPNNPNRGIVEEVGPEVRSLKKGDRVVTAFDIGCGHCWWAWGGMGAGWCGLAAMHGQLAGMAAWSSCARSRWS